MVELDIAEGVAQVWLSRPETRNALDEAFIAELTRTFRSLASRTDVHIVVIGGRGPAFCSGADLGWMQRMAAASQEANREDALALASLFESLDALPQPTLARIHGACFGGAIGLICACDIALATTTTRFAFSEVRLGLVPATILPYALRAIGHRAASQVMLTGEIFDSAYAKEISLIQHGVAEAELDAATATLIAALRLGAPDAQRETKKLLRALHARPLDESVQRQTAAVIAAARVSPEAQRRLRAFLAR